MNKAIELALITAYRAHKGQRRKYTGEPYICHPIAVAQIIEDYGFGGDVICAALLHDTVEDTELTNNDIRAVFGEGVAGLVAEVTDISKPTDGNREKRKALDRKHISKASFAGKAIKLADLINNTSSISTYDKGFAKTYLKEKSLILEVMNNAHPALLEEARNVLNKALAEIEGD